MEKGGAVCMMSNFTNTVIYTGVTSDLFRRVNEHKNGLDPKSFTFKYKVIKLVYFESNTYQDEILKSYLKFIWLMAGKKSASLINFVHIKQGFYL